MNTAMLLAARFESPTVPLVDIAEEFFGLGVAEAKRQANTNALPVPVVRLRQSERAPWLVHVDDLAQFIDAQLAQARKSWANSNTF